MHYGGVGDTSTENPEPQDMDNDSQDNYQDENIVQQLICKTECLKQAIEDRDNDPRDAIPSVRTKAKSINTHTVPSIRTYWGSIKTNTLKPYALHKRTHH